MSLFWDWMYLIKQTPWDTGITPPEIVAMLDSGRVSIGRALDLGCGTGTNAIYLARRGFDVIGIDLSHRAIALARRKARSAEGAAIRFERGDVAQLQRWVAPNSIGFAFDIGCFHKLSAAARDRYADGLLAVLQPGAVYMLYAFDALPDGRGVTEGEIATRFATGLVIEQIQHGGDRNGRSSAWYTLSKHI